MPQEERLAEHEREGRAQSRRLALAGSLSPAQPRAEQQEERGEKQPVARIAYEAENDLVDVRKPRYAAYKAPKMCIRDRSTAWRAPKSGATPLSSAAPSSAC